MIRRRATLLLVSLIAMLCLPGASRAGVQASGSLLILPSDSTLVKNQIFTIAVRVFNFSSNLTPPNNDPVPATLTGTTRVQLACANSSCLTSLPGTIQFQSCALGAAGVASCVLDPTDPSGNTVLVTMTPGGVAIGPNASATLVTITARAAVGVSSPANGQFFIAGATGFSDFQACEQPAGSPCVSGGGQGSSTLFFPCNGCC